MDRPTWGTVIGLLMIAFGGCSVLNDIQAINLPSKLEEQKATFNEKFNKSNKADTLALANKDSIALDQSATENPEKEKNIEFAKKALDMPEATKTWIVRFGYIGILVSLIYLLGGVFLLIPKNFSIKLVYGALILSIAFSAAKTIVLLSPGSASGMIALTMGATQLFGVLVDIILLSVVFSSDKDAYAV